MPAGIEIHLLFNPIERNSFMKTAPTSLTPSRFSVGLSMLTVFSNSAMASALLAST